MERGREEPEVGGPLQGDYGATMGKLWDDNCDGLGDVWMEKMREGGAEGIWR